MLGSGSQMNTVSGETCAPLEQHLGHQSPFTAAAFLAGPNPRVQRLPAQMQAELFRVWCDIGKVWEWQVAALACSMKLQPALLRPTYQTRAADYSTD